MAIRVPRQVGPSFPRQRCKEYVRAGCMRIQTADSAQVARMEGVNEPNRNPITLFTLNSHEDLSQLATGCDADIGGTSSINLTLEQSSPAEKPFAKFWGDMRLDVHPQLRGRVRGGYAGFRNKVRVLRPLLLDRDLRFSLAPSDLVWRHHGRRLAPQIPRFTGSQRWTPSHKKLVLRKHPNRKPHQHRPMATPSLLPERRPMGGRLRGSSQSMSVSGDADAIGPPPPLDPL